ncbi:MAG: MBL fold metallo-hydrolase [Promethearchaeota archaeon]
MKEVYPGIFKITEKGSMGVIKPSENIYVIGGPDALMFDAGYGNKKIIAYVVKQIKEITELYKLQGKKFKISRILPSHAHPDHFSGAKRLRKALGAKIILSKKTARIIKNRRSFKVFFEPDRDNILSKGSFSRKIKDNLQGKLWRSFYYKTYGLDFITDPDEFIEEGDILFINEEAWKIIASPGHSPDHISLYNEKYGILFSGDNILRTITTWLGPPHCNIDDYIKSVKKIQNLPNLKLIFPSHGSPIDNPKERIQEILAHREERTRQVLELVNENPLTGISPSGIVNKLYPDEGLIMQNTARGWIVLTLQLLEEKNLIRREVGRKKIKFFPIK